MLSLFPLGYHVIFLTYSTTRVCRILALAFASFTLLILCAISAFEFARLVSYEFLSF